MVDKVPPVSAGALGRIWGEPRFPTTETVGILVVIVCSTVTL